MDAIVETTGGRLRGTRLASGLCQFRGVPYGASTAGANRFLPPQPVLPWAGIRDATDFAPECPNPGKVPIGKPLNPAVEARWAARPARDSEDCLALNVWTPATDDAKRPVMLWCHGGAWRGGNGDILPARLAIRQDVVVVSVNHRLNLFGYLRLGDAFGEEYAASGHVGMLDIAAALAWVRDNIAAFGGDPSRVMLYGTSGGGAKTLTAMAMPAFRGLFHSATVMSGHDLWKRDSVEIAERTTAQLLALLDIAPGNIGRLQALSQADLVRAHRMVESGFTYPGQWGASGWTFYDIFAPVADGVFLPQRPIEAIAGGAARDVPLMLGVGRHDHWKRGAAARTFETLTPAQMATHLRPHLGERTEAIMAAYRDAMPGASSSSLLMEIVSDMDWRMPAIRLAEASARGGNPAWSYFANWTSGAGAVHAVLYDPPGKSLEPDDAGHGLFGQIAGAFAGMARDGTPAHSGLPDWPRYTEQRRAAMLLDFDMRVEEDAWDARRQAWDGLR